MLEQYIVICRADRTPEGEPGRYELATRATFLSADSAELYASSLSLSREPIVVAGRFGELRAAETVDKLRDLTAEEHEALQAFAAEHGRLWKSHLRSIWDRAVIPAGEPTTDRDTTCYALRNSHGPAWLITYRLPR